MVIERLIVGGAETVALELARVLKRRGCYVSVAAIRGSGGRRDEFAGASTVIHDGLASNRFDLTAAVRIARIIRKERIESVIVVDALRNGLLFSTIGATLSGRKVARICWCHASPGRQVKDFVRQLKIYLATGLLDEIVCVSRYLREELLRRGLSQQYVRVVHNGINLNGIESAAPATDFPEDKRILVQVANVQPWKDFETLLSATSQLVGLRGDFHLVLVGRGTDSPEMTGRIARAGLKDFVTPAGVRHDVPAILAAADVCILSTHVETFGVAVLEGMAASVPVVASDVESLTEVFTHEAEGLKVPPGDSDALAGAIGRLLDDETLRRQMGHAGKKRAEEFSSERMADGFQQMPADS
ncbi:MAG: glycosyltransferase family 4 protein [Phycisphaerae bacterium]|nr:glycosyltransferase family 4 protein [Phycisphaerae bacterium]